MEHTQQILSPANCPDPQETQPLPSDPPSQPLQAVPRCVWPTIFHRHRGDQWQYKVISNKAEEYLDTKIGILNILRDIHKLEGHVPFIESNDSHVRVIRYPAATLYPFGNAARCFRLSYKDVQFYKRNLLYYYKILYKNGVIYNLILERLYLYKLVHQKAWMLFLGSVESSELLDKPQLDWDKQKHNVRAQIDHAFTYIETEIFKKSITDLARSAKKEFDEATSRYETYNTTNEDKTNLAAPEIIIKADYEIIQNAYALVTKAEKIAKKICGSIINVHCRQCHAQEEDRSARLSMQRSNILKQKANVLTQTYGCTKSNNTISTPDEVPHPSTELEQVLETLRRISDLEKHVPQIKRTPNAQTFTITFAHGEFIWGQREVRRVYLSYREIQEIKNRLYRFIESALKGNAYPHSWKYIQQLFPGLPGNSNLPNSTQLDWKKQEDDIWNQIDCIFAPHEIWMFQQEAADLDESAKEEMDSAKPVIDKANDILDMASSALNKALTIVDDARDIITRASTTMMKTSEVKDAVIAPNFKRVSMERQKRLSERIDFFCGDLRSINRKYSKIQREITIFQNQNRARRLA
ncbi:hypothetical protein V8C37DRAFT_397808 [Trichoderma ceciliae]